MNLDDLSKTINKNHLEVCQRLTAIETTQKDTESLSTRVGKLEKSMSYIKGVGGVFVLVWSGLLTLLDIRFHR